VAPAALIKLALSTQGKCQQECGEALSHISCCFEVRQPAVRPVLAGRRQSCGLFCFLPALLRSLPVPCGLRVGSCCSCGSCSSFWAALLRPSLWRGVGGGWWVWLCCARSLLQGREALVKADASKATAVLVEDRTEHIMYSCAVILCNMSSLERDHQQVTCSVVSVQ
jgi:hypothetical protein